MPQEKTNKTKEKKNLLSPKVIIPVVIALVLVLALTITAVGINTGDNIRGGVLINGLNVGNMSKQEAQTLLDTTMADFNGNHVLTVKYEDETKQITFAEIMSGYDIPGAVEKAYAIGRSGNAFADFFKSVGIKFKNENIQVQPIVDEAYLSQMMDSFDMLTKDPMQKNTYSVENGRLKLAYGLAGYVMDRETAVADIKSALVSAKDATVSINKIQQQPGEFDIDEIYQQVCKEPVDAKYEIIDGIGYLASAEDGYRFKKEELKKIIDENKGQGQPFYLDMEVLKPAKTTVDTSGIFTDVLAKYTSRITDSNANRLTNVRLASEKINGVILNPGDTFYYLRHVEPITVAGGYKIANVYSNGKIQQDIGGGVCQVSSALYSAVLEADLEVVKRYNHSLTVAYVPLGQDATVASGEIDLRFKNNTKAPIKIVSQFDPSGVTVILYGKKPVAGRTVEVENITVETMYAQTIEKEDPTLEPGAKVTDVNPKTGYVVDTYKKIYQDGVFVEREYVSRSVYKVLHKQVRVGPNVDVPASADQDPEQTPVPGQTPEPTPSPNPEQPLTTPTPAPMPTPGEEIPVPVVPTQTPELV